jgi:hypothetical protein
VPLQDEQARQLIAQCRQAPFGKGQRNHCRHVGAQHMGVRRFTVQILQ